MLERNIFIFSTRKELHIAVGTRTYVFVLLDAESLTGWGDARSKRVAVADSTGSAVGKVAVVRKVAAPAAGSIEPVVLGLDTATEAAGGVAVEVVYYTPTVLEDMVMMIRKSSGSATE